MYFTFHSLTVLVKQQLESKEKLLDEHEKNDHDYTTTIQNYEQDIKQFKEEMLKYKQSYEVWCLLLWLWIDGTPNKWNPSTWLFRTEQKIFRTSSQLFIIRDQIQYIRIKFEDSFLSIKSTRSGGSSARK